ncbi:MAG: heparan-alpha-glucosaminide N-acetyltransferase domain-containing protein [Terracidiphilus sp.]|jgi:predicted acyltransferase
MIKLPSSLARFQNSRALRSSVKGGVFSKTPLGVQAPWFSKSGAAVGPQKRLLSLDVLRGLTIAFMIMVNNSGAGAWAQMHHAAWNGLTATDLVFPTFLFLVGVSIVFSTEARLRRGDSRAKLAGHALLRAVILFALGVFSNGFPHFHLQHLRIYGVLQRIAVCYLIVALLYLWDRRVWTKVLLLVCLLVGYWALVRWVPVPGAGVPGRDVPFLDKDQNIVAWLDRQLMPGHLYEEFTDENPSNPHNTRDPEGLLSDIPAIGTALLGLLTGLWLKMWLPTKFKTLGLIGAAAALLATGYLWAIWFPLNKKMWTSSYVLVAAGWSLLALALLYWLMEQRGWGQKGWSKALAWPWLVFGSNAIVAYVISEELYVLLKQIHFTDGGKASDPLRYVFQHVFMHISDPGWRSFVYVVVYTAVCFLPVWLLYRRKIFVKI